ncbi:MAG: LD-carboxypeptidase, partial [Flavobacteriales bacterium]
MNGKTVRIPAPLSPGDGIQLAAPARFVTAEQIDAAAVVIQSAGFEPVIPDALLARDGQFGGDDAHRAHQLNSGFKHDRVRAIWAMRGGYGCGRVLPWLDRNAYVENPTWLIGFSDITALHAWSQNLGVASLHAPVA